MWFSKLGLENRDAPAAANYAARDWITTVADHAHRTWWYRGFIYNDLIKVLVFKSASTL
jgi:hypothetical protein